MTTRPRAIFFGSPDFAVPCLEALLEIADVPLVITQPDRPAGRGLSLRKPAVKVFAEEAGIPVLQPTKVRTTAFAETLSKQNADVGVVVAYGRILPLRVLETPKHGCVNVHASLLPRGRGAAPIQWSIVHGDEKTGVCLMKMDVGMDTGPVIAQDETPIEPDETAGELFERLAPMGAAILKRELPRYLNGELTPQPQNAERATMAPMLKKQDGLIDWSVDAQEVHDRVRGMSPWPSAFTTANGKRVRLHVTEVKSPVGNWAKAGEVLRASKHGVDVACKTGLVRIKELQLDGKKRLNAVDFLSGVKWQDGLILGGESE